MAKSRSGEAETFTHNSANKDDLSVYQIEDDVATLVSGVTKISLGEKSFGLMSRGPTRPEHTTLLTSPYNTRPTSTGSMNGSLETGSKSSRELSRPVSRISTPCRNFQNDIGNNQDCGRTGLKEGITDDDRQNLWQCLGADQKSLVTQNPVPRDSYSSPYNDTQVKSNQLLYPLTSSYHNNVQYDLTPTVTKSENVHFSFGVQGNASLEKYKHPDPTGVSDSDGSRKERIAQCPQPHANIFNVPHNIELKPVIPHWPIGSNYSSHHSVGQGLRLPISNSNVRPVTNLPYGCIFAKEERRFNLPMTTGRPYKPDFPNSTPRPLVILRDIKIPNSTVPQISIDRKTPEAPAPSTSPVSIQPPAQIPRERLTEIDRDGDTYLHIAACHQDQNLILPLLKAFQQAGLLNDAINKPNRFDQTPLYIATVANRHDAVRTLLTWGANPNIRGQCSGMRKEEKAPIHCAAQGGDRFLNTLRELLNSPDIHVDIANSEGLTALHCAIQEHGKLQDGRKEDCRRTVDCLIRAGADPNAKDKKSGKTPLMYAIETKDFNLVSCMVSLIDKDKLRNMLKTQTFDGSNCSKICSGLRMDTHLWSRMNSLLFSSE